MDEELFPRVFALSSIICIPFCIATGLLFGSKILSSFTTINQAKHDKMKASIVHMIASQYTHIILQSPSLYTSALALQISRISAASNPEGYMKHARRKNIPAIKTKTLQTRNPTWACSVKHNQNAAQTTTATKQIMTASKTKIDAALQAVEGISSNSNILPSQSPVRVHEQVLYKPKLAFAPERL